MGLPIQQLVIATNSNDILHRSISNNDYRMQSLQQTLSPSMDIMISSNYERMLFDLYDGDAEQISELMSQLQHEKRIELRKDCLHKAREIFNSYRVDDDDVVRVIRDTYAHSGYLLDPHTAIGVEAAKYTWQNKEVPMVCLATAHPVKFPDAVRASECGADPELPVGMQDLFDREERYEVLPNQLENLQSYISSTIS